MAFSEQIHTIALKWDTKLESTLRAFLVSLSNRVIIRTPVLSGRLRGNWLPGINAAPFQTVETLDVSGGQTLARVRSEATGFTLGDTFYLVNNLPYAAEIEYGKSRVKAPEGMLRVSIAEAFTILERTVKT